MKISKLMLAACVAALPLMSCNMEEAPETPTRLKSIEVNIENAAMTKGLAGDKIESGDAVYVSDFKIFLTDALGNEYTAKQVDGTNAAKTYWNSVDLAAGPIQAEFHYVDPNCTHVIAIANVGKDLTYAEYKAIENLKIENQQDQKNLLLHDMKELQATSEEHTDDQGNGNVVVSQVYTADIVLSPRVSRFEVDGFSIKFDATNPKYNEINVTQLAIQNYFPETNPITGDEAGALVNPITNFADQGEVYGWLDDASKPVVWSRDYFDITLTPANPTVDTPNPLAYHVFSSNETPIFVIKLTADGQPAFLYSKGFYKTDGTPITNFEEGYIYRMSAQGQVEKDGSIPFEEDDIDPMDRCLEITVDVKKWAVDLVYPEF